MLHNKLHINLVRLQPSYGTIASHLGYYVRTRDGMPSQMPDAYMVHTISASSILRIASTRATQPDLQFPNSHRSPCKEGLPHESGLDPSDCIAAFVAPTLSLPAARLQQTGRPGPQKLELHRPNVRTAGTPRLLSPEAALARSHRTSSASSKSKPSFRIATYHRLSEGRSSHP